MKRKAGRHCRLPKISGKNEMTKLNWQIKSFHQLNGDELYEILKLRVDVFVVEQACPYPELDGKDRHSQTLHVMGKDGNNKICAYLRILAPGVSYKQSSIGRVVVEKKHRGNGSSRQMVGFALEAIKEKWPDAGIKIGAQTYLKNFYASFGFTQISESYLEDGIPHIDMVLKNGR